MKSTVFRYLTFAAGIALMCACDTRDIQIEGNTGVTLTVLAPGAGMEISNTKAATQDGVDDLNENTINSVYYFLYQMRDMQTYATDAPKVHGFYTSLDFKDSKTWTIPVSTSTIVNELFPDGTRKCNAFVVANPPASLVSMLEKGEASITELRAALIETSLIGRQDNFTMVFDDEVELDSRNLPDAMSIVADMRRLAAKITVNLEVNESFFETETNFTWTPEVESAKLEFSHAMNKTNLAADFAAAAKARAIGDDNYFDVPAIDVDESSVRKEDGIYKASFELPVYSYPMDWDFTDKYEPSILIELPWKRQLESGYKYATCYYRMFLNMKKIASNSWYNITVQLSVLGSFSKVDPTVKYLYEEYQVLPWTNAFSTNNNVDANIRDARYLVVNEKDIILKDVEAKDVPFSSSHTVKVKSATYSHKRYDSKTEKFVTDTGLDCKNWFTVNGSVLEFRHELRNDIYDYVKGIDTTPYTITVVLQHDDQPATSDKFIETITITQYPAITVTEEENMATVTHNGLSSSTDFTGKGTRGDAYVNGQFRYLVQGSNISDTNDTYPDYRYVGSDANSRVSYNTIRGDQPQRGNAPYMYVVETQSVPVGSRYIITDPRNINMENQFQIPYSATTTGAIISDKGPGESVDILNFSITYATVGKAGYKENVNEVGSATDAALTEGPTRKLKYYYSTQTTKEAENYIAPKFRIASPYSGPGTSGVPGCEYINMLRRCATYQEAGLPAGRWRLPTMSEIIYVFELQKQNALPAIFSSQSSGYWCSTGALQIKDTNGSADYTLITNKFSDGEYSVRCVYDEWYWENTDNYVTNTTYQTTNGRLPESLWGKFVWGDMPRK